MLVRPICIKEVNRKFEEFYQSNFSGCLYPDAHLEKQVRDTCRVSFTQGYLEARMEMLEEVKQEFERSAGD